MGADAATRTPGPGTAARSPRSAAPPGLHAQDPRDGQTGRTDILATNKLASALYLGFGATPERPANFARFVFLDSRAPASTRTGSEPPPTTSPCSTSTPAARYLVSTPMDGVLVARPGMALLPCHQWSGGCCRPVERHALTADRDTAQLL
ncbi:MmyB family transcriptional regulator [Parenemella sanctibonifatiensis]|uniref:MmyB family transcriptional regulator n=1 Tax=Parenemella sanctibonifatiensis TaxID=2016505 RepID=UPI0015C5B953